jgi:hypothetical protein
MKELPEEWRPVSGYEGIYSVSNHGKVRRDLPYEGRKTVILKHCINRYGYPQVSLCYKRIQRSFRVHVLVANSFIGIKPDGLEINHKNGNKQDNTVHNLEYVSHSYNNLHAFRTGIRKPVPLKGEMNGQCKLTKNDVLDIRDKYALGFSKASLAHKHMVSSTQISRIVSNRSWKHIK